VLDWLNQPSAADLPWMIGMLLVVRTFCWSWRERSRRKTMMAILDKEMPSNVNVGIPRAVWILPTERHDGLIPSAQQAITCSQSQIGQDCYLRR
jgi:hypothetical protein